MPSDLHSSAGSRLPFAKASNLSENDIERIAEQFAKAVGYQPGDDISPIVERKLGGKIAWLDLDVWLDDLTDTIEVEGPGLFTIFLSRVGGLLRNRFTLAHELGHYVLHSGFGKIPLRAARSGKNERAEWEANCFAASFLMPREEFSRVMQQSDHSINRVAAHFLVSPSDVRARQKSIS